MGKFGKAMDVAKNSAARKTVASSAKASAKGARVRAGQKASSAASKGRRVKKQADTRVAFGKESAKFGAGKASSVGKRKASAVRTRAQGTGPTKGAGPNKTRSTTVRGTNLSKNTYGNGTKRITVVSAFGKQTGKASARGKTVAITPKKRKIGYAAGAGAVGSAGGYTTYKRKTRSGKIVTVRRRSSR